MDTFKLTARCDFTDEGVGPTELSTELLRRGFTSTLVYGYRNGARELSHVVEAHKDSVDELLELAKRFKQDSMLRTYESVGGVHRREWRNLS